MSWFVSVEGQNIKPYRPDDIWEMFQLLDVLTSSVRQTTIPSVFLAQFTDSTCEPHIFEFYWKTGSEFQKTCARRDKSKHILNKGFLMQILFTAGAIIIINNYMLVFIPTCTFITWNFELSGSLLWLAFIWWYGISVLFPMQLVLISHAQKCADKFPEAEKTADNFMYTMYWKLANKWGCIV